jgi:very-short-patch-repair endonuclease
MGEGWGGGDSFLGDGLADLAKSLRKRKTEAEKLLWWHLRSKQINSLKFRRQQPIGPFIADFVCFEKRLVIELDGGQHAIEQEKDREREGWFNKEGFRILRFWNTEVLQNIEGVVEVMRRACLHHPPLTPPIKGGGYLTKFSAKLANSSLEILADSTQSRFVLKGLRR